MPIPEPIHRPLHLPVPAGLQRLHDFLLAEFPGTHSGGIYNPNSFLDDGVTPSAHQVPQACDIMCDQPTAGRIIRYLQGLGDVVNLQQCIAWHEIVTADRWSEGIRYYGAGDHSDGNGHAHVHVGWAVAQSFDPSWITATPITEDDVDPEAKAWIKDLHDGLVQSKGPDNLPMVTSLWKNIFQGAGSSFFTGELRKALAGLAARLDAIEKKLGI